MTREDAKYILSGLMKSLNEYCGLNDTGFKAFNMAIQALEQKPCENAITIDWLTNYMNGMIAGSDRWLGVKWMLEDWMKWKEGGECPEKKQ